jgi:hypothetical protein
MQHRAARRSSALRIRCRNTPPAADEDLGERRYARAIYLMRKNELHVSRRAMVTKYPMCSRLITI